MSVPGQSSHFIMIPEIRARELKNLNIEQKKARNAAVLMLLYPKNEVTHLVLILRPEYEGVHSGQIALPGGKVETCDLNYTATALRETQEEVGVDSAMITVIKSLTKVYIPPSNFWVHPFLGFAEKRPDFVPQEDEVAKIIEVPLVELLNDDNIVPQKLTTSYAKNIEVPSFKLNDYVVWGATAMMLSELKILLKTEIDF